MKYTLNTICSIVLVLSLVGCEPMENANVKVQGNPWQEAVTKSEGKLSRFNWTEENTKDDFRRYRKAKTDIYGGNKILETQFEFMKGLAETSRQEGQRIFGSESARLDHEKQKEKDGVYSIIKVLLGHHCIWCEQASKGGYYHPPN